MSLINHICDEIEELSLAELHIISNKIEEVRKIKRREIGDFRLDKE